MAANPAAKTPGLRPGPQPSGPEPSGSGPLIRHVQGLVQVMLLGGRLPLPVAVNPKVVEAFGLNVPL